MVYLLNVVNGAGVIRTPITSYLRLAGRPSLPSTVL